MPASRERKYGSLLEQLVVATNREDRRENYRDFPAKDLYSRIELI